MLLPAIRLTPFAVFLCSSVVGMLLSIVHLQYQAVTENLLHSPAPLHSISYADWLHSQNISFETTSTDDDDSQPLISESLFLKKRIRILCFVLAKQESSSFLSLFHSKSKSSKSLAASSIVRTWGKRCSKIVFFGLSPSQLPSGVSALRMKSKSAKKWSILRDVLVQLSNNYLDSYDWFLGVRQDAYVVLENLRYYLSIYDPNAAHYLGHPCESWGVTYNSDRAGFVLSRGALRKLHNQLIIGHCSTNEQNGDVELGRCLGNVGIHPFDTRDNGGHARFLLMNPEAHLVPNRLSWVGSLVSKSKYKIKEGPSCCSDYAITFQDINPDTMRILDYMVYHLKPYGMSIRLKD